MTYRKLPLLLLAAASLFATSCNRYYYKPNAVNTPLFTDGGQAHLNAAGSIGDGDGAGKTSFFDLQASYSPIKYLGIIGNYSTYSFTPDNYNFYSGNVAAKAHLVEAGIGGYYPVGDKKFKMVVEMYAGGGVGRLNSDVNMDVTKLFLQPGIGVTSPWFDAAFNMRVSNINYSNLDDNGRGDNYLLDRNLIDPNNNRHIDDGTFTFLEPSITVRVGYKFAKAQFQSVFSNSTSTFPWRYNGARFTAGFYFSLEGVIDAARENRSKGDQP
ncbi:MAG: hypothetical protein EOP51_11930 [Sphingobacteriales bacterium]|nr:MAG: hypothetical protein EOP51_11930 [Sphingobacteriales bacterium]